MHYIQSFLKSGVRNIQLHRLRVSKWWQKWHVLVNCPLHLLLYWKWKVMRKARRFGYPSMHHSLSLGLVVRRMAEYPVNAQWLTRHIFGAIFPLRRNAEVNPASMWGPFISSLLIANRGCSQDCFTCWSSWYCHRMTFNPPHPQWCLWCDLHQHNFNTFVTPLERKAVRPPHWFLQLSLVHLVNYKCFSVLFAFNIFKITHF